MKSKNTPEILDYLARQPGAQDTIEGIIHWWMLDACLRTSAPKIAKTVAQLVERGFLEEKQSCDGRIFYRVSPHHLATPLEKATTKLHSRRNPANHIVMTTDELKQGLKQLDQLSEADYHQPLSDVIAAKNPEEVFKRVGRLVGVTIKEPFAKPKTLPTPSRETRSYRAWDLEPERLESSAAKSTWQYRTLEALRMESPAARHLTSVQELAIDAHHERGFFGHLARSVQKYICDDPKLRKKIDKSLAAAKAAGFSAKHLRPETFVTSGGVALGTLLIAHIPFLGIVGAPVIAGIVLVLYSIGTDAFCSYVQDQYANKEK